jgi:RNA polymerase sigma-70 factor (ECF subfamily)
MKNSSEKVVLEKAKRFETQALEDIFDAYSPGIYRYAYRLLGDAELARECMSETFSRFLTALKRESGPDNYLQAYLYRIAQSAAAQAWRKRAVSEGASLDEHQDVAACAGGSGA